MAQWLRYVDTPDVTPDQTLPSGAGDAAIALGLRAALTVNGRQITYHQEGQDPVSFAALKGKYQAAALAGEVIVGEAELTDWIFPAELLAGEPTKKDWLTCNGQRFDLCPVPGLKCWGRLNPGNTWIRVHSTVTERET